MKIVLIKNVVRVNRDHIKNAVKVNREEVDIIMMIEDKSNLIFTILL